MSKKRGKEQTKESHNRQTRKEVKFTRRPERKERKQRRGEQAGSSKMPLRRQEMTVGEEQGQVLRLGKKKGGKRGDSARDGSTGKIEKKREGCTDRHSGVT